MLSFNFIPLHVHDEDASVGDSILNLKAYVEEGARRHLPALAITNHGSMASMYKFYNLCKENHIKPIFGNEFYVSRESNDELYNFIHSKAADKKNAPKPKETYHCVILVMNAIGLKNALFLTSYSATQTFYEKPIITEEVLFAHSEGLICLTACIGGMIPQMILQNQATELIQAKIQEYANVFKDRFYLELQPGCFAEQLKVNAHLVRYARLLNLPLVATNDIHYLKKEDAAIHNLHVACYRNEKVISVDAPLLYKDDCYYFKEAKDFDLKAVDPTVAQEAMRNTQVIADKCDSVALPEEVQMPIFDNTLTREQTKNLLVSIATQKLERLTPLLKDPYTYSERLFHEISVIDKLGFIDYFLIVRDVLEFARKEGIPVGPGRGSAAGSLLAYMLDITCVDSIKYGLKFERFISEDRKEPPDIDLDLMSARRNELFTYIQKKYGYDYCAQVSTKGYRKAKSAIKDAARALNIPDYVEVGQAIADLIPVVIYDDIGEKETDLDIERALKISQPLRDYKQQYPDLFRFAIGLQNKPKSNSIHAAGILIFPHKLDAFIPLRLSKTPMLPASSLDLKDAENIAIKFDFLSIRTLDMNADIEQMTGYVFDYEDEQLLQDESAWDIIRSKYNAGLFQISSSTYKKRMCRLKPKNIKELAACLALVRGPCISSRADEKYMLIKEGKAAIELVHPIYDVITKDTLGILVYQEQAMALFQAGGLTKSESYTLMKLLAKKNLDKAKIYKDSFYKGCVAQSIPTRQIDSMWHLVEESAKYSFNESHAVSYALITLKTAYYKAHFPHAFFTALLTHEFNGDGSPKDKAANINIILKEVKAYGYSVILPDINTCKSSFTMVEGTSKIMAGTCAIKSFGRGLELMQKGRPFTKIEDVFLNRTPYVKGQITQKACKELWKAIPVASKRSVIAGIFAGLFDSLYSGKKTRKQIYEDYIAARRIYEDFNDCPLETINITKQISIKTTQPNKELEQAMYSVKF